MKVFYKLIFVPFLLGNAYCQNLDSMSYMSFRDNPIIHGDVGYNTAPFSMNYNFRDDIKKVKYRHNFKTMVGIGFAHKWFALRIAGAVIGNSRPVSRFGNANYLDLGLNFAFKKTYYELDFRAYTGYVVMNSKKWDSNYNDLKPNDIDQSIASYNLSVGVWYLANKNFKISPFNGIRGKYYKPVTTWYLEGRLDLFGINNEKGSIVPSLLVDTLNDKTGSSSLSALDIGVIPGIGHVGSLKRNWQYGLMVALGPRIQIKSYTVSGVPTSLLAIVGRYDAKLVFGYNVPKFFAMLSIELDNKSVAFLDFRYRQSFYSMRLSLGYRFKKTIKKVKNKT